MRVFLLLVILLLAACNLNGQPATPTRQPPSLAATALPTITAAPTRTPAFQSNATLSSRPGASSTTERAAITTPTSGASVSANPLSVSGIVYNLSGDHINLQLLDANNQPLTPIQAIALTHAAQIPWSASLTAGIYTGAAQLKVTDVFGKVIGTTSFTITASASAVQPSSGSYVGSITTPANGSSVSGDPLTVTGTAGGIAENQFTLLLLAADGTTLNSQTITLSGADQYMSPGRRRSAPAVIMVRPRFEQWRRPQSITLASVTITLQ